MDARAKERTAARLPTVELLEARRALAHEERLAALAEVVAGLAHEARTPLTSIRNGMEVLRRRVPPEDAVAREAAAMMEDGVERVDGLVQELRVYARGGSGAREACDLAEVVREAVTLFHASRRTLPPIHVDLAASGTFGVHRAQLHVLVLNLLRNAVDATRDGTPVRVTTRQEGAGVRLRVEDGGHGIPEALRERVFDPRFTTREGGTGLGLAIVRRIAADHGARVALGTTPEGGTRVDVTFVGG